MLKVCNENIFYLGGKLGGRAWKCLFYSTEDKKRRANTKIGATFTSFWFMFQTLYKCYSRSPLFGHLLNSDTFFRALHFEPGRSPYDLFVLFFLVNSLSTDIRHYRNTFLWSRRQLSSPIHYFCSIIRIRVRVNVFGVNIYFTEVFVNDKICVLHYTVACTNILNTFTQIEWLISSGIEYSTLIICVFCRIYSMTL